MRNVSRATPRPAGITPRFAMFPAEMTQYLPRGRQRDVYVALRLHTDADTGVCWPTEATLAEEVGCSVRTVERAIRELRESGVIEVSPRLRRGRKVHNQYRVALDAAQVELNRRRARLTLIESPVDNTVETVDNDPPEPPTEPTTAPRPAPPTEPTTGPVPRENRPRGLEQTSARTSRGGARWERDEVENTIEHLAGFLRRRQP